MRTAYEAVHDFKETFQRILSCFAPKTVYVQVSKGYAPGDGPFGLTCNNGKPLPLRGPRDLALSLRQSYQTVKDEREWNSYRVSTLLASRPTLRGDALRLLERLNPFLAAE